MDTNSPRKPPPSRETDVMLDRARRARWLADMTIDRTARQRLVGYAQDLEAAADAAVPPVALRDMPRTAR